MRRSYRENKITFANYCVLQFFSFLNAASYFLPVKNKCHVGIFCAKILFFEKPETIWSVFYCKQKEPHIGSTKVGKRTKVRKQVESRKKGTVGTIQDMNIRFGIQI